jgi:beta-lactamase regulating signal transducer with metallopeptidase domain
MHLPSDELLHLAWTQFWQIAVLTIVVAVVVQIVGRRRSHLSHLLWMLVIVKALTPPLWSSPTGAFCWATATTTSPRVELAGPVPADPPHAASDGAMLPTTFQTQQIPQHDSAQSPPSRPAAANSAGDWLLLSWLAGSAVLFSITLYRRFVLGGLVRHTTTKIDADNVRQFEDLRRRIGPHRPVRLVLTSAPLGPAAYGWWHGTVIVPQALVEGRKPADTAPIFAHELVHLRRFDTLSGSLQLAAQLIWWFHPAVWWANRQARIERERACDEEVVAELDCRPADYARLLLQVLSWRHHLTPTLLWPGMRAGDVTSRRLQHILHPTGSFRRRTPVWCWLALAVAVAVALPGAGMNLAAAPPPTKKVAIQPATPPSLSAGPGAKAFAPPNQQAIIAKLKKLGIQVQVAGSMGPDGQFKMHPYATLPASFRPSGEPLAAADLEPLPIVTVGAQPPAPQPSEQRLREQLLALQNLPPATTLTVMYSADNVAALDALEEIPALVRLGLLLYSSDPAVAVAAVPFANSVRLDRLTNLRFLSCSPAEADLARIATLKNLEDLALQNVSEPALDQLAALKSLKSLRLSQYHFDQPAVALDLAYLGGMPKLEKLYVDGMFLLGDAAAARIGGCSELRELSADISPMTDAGLRQLAQAKNLQSVIVQSTQGAELSSVGLGALGALVNLERLEFYAEALPHRTPLVVTDEALAEWNRLRNLKTLRADLCRISDAGLRVIGRLTALKRLQLVGQLDITDKGLAPLAALKDLQALVLHDSKIDGSGFSALDGMDNLRLLSLKNTPISDRGLEAIANFSNLRALDLSDTAITDAGLAHLLDKLPKLARLNLARTQISDHGFTAIADHKNVRDLNASGTALTVASMARLLETNPDLTIWTSDSAAQIGSGASFGHFQAIDIDGLGNHLWD